ncbi:MAG: M20 family peptidase, partial [bacterium]
MKKVLFVIGVGFVLLISVLLIRTARFTFTSKPVQVQSVTDITLNNELTAQHLAEALRFKTISYQDSTKFNGKAFQALHDFLEKAFPNVHSSLKKEIINSYSLLYTWQGSDPSVKPILLMAHQDVVPVIPATEKDWAYPPFEGKIAEGYVWGRGALDDKSGMMGILEAVEALLRDGFQPMRTVYIAFGHDEEIGGLKGAAKIAELFQSRNIQFEYVLDEGGTIVQGIIPGLSGIVAIVGIAEKGYVSLELTVHSEGGHSSMPPKNTTVGILSKAITKLEENPFPANMSYTTQFIKHVGPKMPFLNKMVFANLWLSSPLVEKVLSKSPEMNAGIRTTTAATMFSGSVKENVLPIKATAVVNFRIMPGESIASVIEYVNKIINDSRVQIRPKDFGSEPSSVSDIHSKSYDILQKTIHQVSVDEELIIAPFLVVGATDSRYFTGLSDNVYRFMFNKISSEDLKRV